MGFPAGLPKTMLVDLEGLVSPEENRVRITTSMRLYWDRIQVASVVPEASLVVMELDASAAELRDALETHLRHEPTKVSKSRIKRLRGMAKPQYRLRVGETRVFYDVRDETVEVLAIVAKRQAERWLQEEGTPQPDSGTGEGEG
jgi:mRNA-degrading endonuclease RelE of RelBE toxin-antitoxin system